MLFIYLFFVKHTNIFILIFSYLFISYMLKLDYYEFHQHLKGQLKFIS